MSKINILPAQVYNRIAAGEVVDRPYSVVKELVENSIDAGATEIEIYVENGGKQLIRVVDNGSGIARDDLQAAFLPHATSKISKAEKAFLFFISATIFSIGGKIINTFIWPAPLQCKLLTKRAAHNSCNAQKMRLSVGEYDRTFEKDSHARQAAAWILAPEK